MYMFMIHVHVMLVLGLDVAHSSFKKLHLCYLPVHAHVQMP